jgi:hypothetical protein
MKSGKELIRTRRSWILTWFNACSLILTKKELIKCYLYVLDILGSNLIIWRRFSKNEPMKDIKWWVRQDSSWRRINKDSAATMNHTSEKSKWESWHRGTVYDGEGQMNVQYEESYITMCQSLFNQEMKWLGYQKWKLIIRYEVLQVTTSKSQCLSKIKCDNPHKVEKRWSGKIQYCASSSWRSWCYI